MEAAVERAWAELRERVVRMEALDGVHGLLEWDQMTMMPPGSAEARGQQFAALAAIRHGLLVDPALGDLLQVLSTSSSADPVQRAAARNLVRDRERAVRLPVRLVEELERARARGHQDWLQARSERRFDVFAPALERLVGLAREVSGHLAVPGDDIYDPLLDAYEPGMKVRELEPLLARLEQGLVTLLEALRGVAPLPAHRVPLAVPLQERVCRRVVEALGFSFATGRMDTSVHPFTCGLAPTDVRITTRYQPDDLLGALGSAIHEAGHALYEQGAPPRLQGTGAGRPRSMGLHESQSRFWENAIGGSRPFQAWLAGVLQDEAGLAVDPEDLYRSCNRVQPGLIRVTADEATYNLHILLRFRLELALLAGDLPVGDLEGAWNDASGKLLGLRPAHPVEGVLQDVHWSEGLFGYFPAYTLGNLYAAGLARGLETAVPALWEQVARGDFAAALAWMREHVHDRAGLDDAAGVVREAVGERDLVDDLLRHLWTRHGALHGLRPPADLR